MTKKLVATFLTGMLLAAGASARQGVLGPMPEAEGTVDAIDLAAHNITFDGKTYRITNRTRWVGLEPGQSPRDVAAGLVKKQLGFRSEAVGSDKVVTEIWLVR